ncbi:MAG: archease [Syntrophales bacterium]|nr:archease [Syntrophales bacterium]
MGKGSHKQDFFRIFNHTADLGVEVWGQDKEDLLVKAATALVNLITPSPVTAEEKVSLHVEGMDDLDLFVNFLREILYLFNGKRFLASRIEILRCEGKEIVADVWGERFDPAKHEISKEIKAVTYHQTLFAPISGVWKGRFVVDV